MAVTIDIIDENSFLSEQEKIWLTELLQKACTEEKVSEHAELSLTLTNDEIIQEINKEYRGIDNPTDVITFALNDGENELQAELPNLLGDIIISMDKAKEQATSYGHSLERELGFLAVHGLLHLLGYTHDTVETEREMFGRQESILQSHGLAR
ncbi:rRNA maturation RNase YbeY [Bacillus piscicola]|uniref:rRNA maturation RNase YbeY n=1 Tax=Bacillus piscicola TaxID=1632684 RepID=UPI001F08C932|nr:rRNA maturation RNase YbeY [Bacillus piscicola]